MNILHCGLNNEKEDEEIIYRNMCYVFVHIVIFIEVLGLFASFNLFCSSALTSVMLMNCFLSKSFFAPVRPLEK